MADRVLYLFDGYNLLHAGGFEEVRELRDTLASFVATKGARGVLVFDGVGVDETVGALEIRYAPNADTLLERLAAEHRGTHEVWLVSSDMTIRGAAGAEVAKVSSQTFLGDLQPAQHADERPSQLRDRLDETTRAELERRRRG